VITQIPTFKETKHFIRLPNNRILSTYRFKTIEDVEVGLRASILPLNCKISFKDQNGVIRLTLHQFAIKIHSGYAWDGCTPKLCVFGKWLGVPDFGPTILASLVHDSLLQFHLDDGFPLNREQCDVHFSEILNEQDFVFSGVYSLGVKIGSLLYK
jgi:hypothetical protein